MKRNENIAHSRLTDLLNFNPDTGDFTWRVSRNSYAGKARLGAVAGSQSHYGYIDIRIDGGKLFKAHRLAWFYVHGVWPQTDIDHINGNRADNRLLNLRLATRGQNNVNSGRSRRNTSGFKGVSLHKKTSKWVARIHCGGKYKSLGLFFTPEEASVAYQKKAKEIHGEFLPQA